MSDTSHSRAQKFNLAKLLFSADYHNDTIQILKDLINEEPKLTSEEKLLLDEAYYRKIEAARLGIRQLASTLSQEITKRLPEQIQKLNEIEMNIISSITEICKEYIDLIKEKLLPFNQNPTDIAYYYKEIADFDRYILELSRKQKDFNPQSEARHYYIEALDILTTFSQNFPEIDISLLHLQIILNYSVLLHDLLNEKKEALKVAQKGIDGTISIPQDSTSEVFVLQGLIRENRNLWLREDND